MSFKAIIWNLNFSSHFHFDSLSNYTKRFVSSLSLTILSFGKYLKKNARILLPRRDRVCRKALHAFFKANRMKHNLTTSIDTLRRCIIKHISSTRPTFHPFVFLFLIWGFFHLKTKNAEYFHNPFRISAKLTPPLMAMQLKLC